MNKLTLSDEWKEPTAMLQAFHEALRGPRKDKGNPPVTIDYGNLKVGQEVTVKLGRKDHD